LYFNKKYICGFMLRFGFYIMLCSIFTSASGISDVLCWFVCLSVNKISQKVKFWIGLVSRPIHLKISWTFIHNFLTYLVNRQTNKPTKYITYATGRGKYRTQHNITRRMSIANRTCVSWVGLYAPRTIVVNVSIVTWIKRGFNACQKHRNIYSSIFNRFPVIQPVSSKLRIFSTFLHICLFGILLFYLFIVQLV